MIEEKNVINGRNREQKKPRLRNKKARDSGAGVGAGWVVVIGSGWHTGLVTEKE